MAKSLSPLRYPGGKSKIYDKVKTVIETNSLGDKTYVEPFAGGFGIGLGLLCNRVVKSAILNDFDTHIYNFWYSVFHHTDELIKKIENVTVSMRVRKKQKFIYDNDSSDILSNGFATLFLNRVNFSGIINGGPIGGVLQSSDYKIDCRFNKKEIIKKISKIALLRDKIELYNDDASELIKVYLKTRINESFFYIDPPYVGKGKELYTNYFKEDDHKKLGKIITKYLKKTKWIVTYDDCKLIKDIYKDYNQVNYKIVHNAGGTVRGNEIVVTNIPNKLFFWDVS